VSEHTIDALELYVRAALALQGYEFDEEQIAEIILQFSRIESVAQIILAWPLPFTSEAAPAFRP
jgi:1-carboxybiuret hydrolase subunit AtzG-like